MHYEIFIVTLGTDMMRQLLYFVKFSYFRQGSHKLWKSWKTWKITNKNSMHGKIMEFDKSGKIMEFCEISCESNS